MIWKFARCMYSAFPIDHQLRKLWQIIRDFPVHIFSTIRYDRLSQLGFDNNNSGFSKHIFILIQDTCDRSIVCNLTACIAFNILLRKIHIRFQRVLRKNTGITTTLDFLSIDCNRNDRGKLISRDNITV